MSDDSAMTGWLLVLSVGILGLLLAVVFLLLGISKSLFRIERQGGFRDGQTMQRGEQNEFLPSAPSPAMMKKISKESDFMVFLAEDASRRTLPKREQFAAYRAWRQQKGLNWPHDQLASESD